MKFAREFTKFYFSGEGYYAVVSVGGILGGAIGTGYGIYDYQHDPSKNTFYNTVDLSGHMLTSGLGGALAGVLVFGTLPLTIPALAITTVRSVLPRKSTD